MLYGSRFMVEGEKTNKKTSVTKQLDREKALDNETKNDFTEL